MHHNHARAFCQRLLVAELAAIATYADAVARFRGEPVATILSAIGAEHHASAEALRAALVPADVDAEPEPAPEVWDAWKRRAEGPLRLFGQNSALAALQQGEEEGLLLFSEALADGRVSPPVRDMIRDILLPRHWRHVSTLRGLTGTH